MAAYYSPLAEDLASGKLPWGTEEQETVQGKEKIFLVTDTSWWLEEGWKSKILGIQNGLFIIPSGVLKEIDGLKKNKNLSDKAINAERNIFLLVKNKKGIIENTTERLNTLSSHVDEQVVIIGEKLKKQGKKVYVLTTDMGIKTLCVMKRIPYSSSLTHIHELMNKKEDSFLSYIIFILCVFSFLMGFISDAGWFTLGGIFLLIYIRITGSTQESSISKLNSKDEEDENKWINEKSGWTDDDPLYMREIYNMHIGDN